MRPIVPYRYRKACEHRFRRKCNAVGRTAAEEQQATQPNTKVSTLLSSGVTTNKGRYFYYTKVRVRSRTRTQSVLRCACFSSELESSSVQVLACQALKLPAAVF